MLSGEEAPSGTSASRPNGSLFDGSYLSVATNGVQQAQVCSNCVARDGAMKTLPNPTFDSCDSELSSAGGPAEQHTSQRRECRVPHTRYRCQHCQRHCHDSGSGTQEWRSDSGSYPVNSHHDTFNPKERERCSLYVSSHVTSLDLIFFFFFVSNIF